MASNTYGEASITVKVKNACHLPKEYITASKSETGCTQNINIAKDNNFTIKIPIASDTTNLQYSFTLSPCYTAWLRPTNVGPSGIKYIIIDGRDTVSTNGVNRVNYTSPYYFNKHSQQRFLLTIKAP
jgi:hypothetical protein